MLKGYVKPTSNSGGLQLGWDAGIEVVEELGEHVAALVKTGDELEPRQVVGWTDLFTGRPHKLSAYRINWQGHHGILLCGGNSGVRVLANDDDPDFRPDHQAHLPNGWGLPVMFIQDETDFIEFQD
jgi:hypothetical protein